MYQGVCLKIMKFTVSVRSNRTEAVLWSKMPIFKSAYHTLKILSHLCPTKILWPLIRAFNWGIIKGFSSRDIRMVIGQSLKLLSLLNKKGVFGNFYLWPLAVFIPLEENPPVVPHLKALISGKKSWAGHYGSSDYFVRVFRVQI